MNLSRPESPPQPGMQPPPPSPPPGPPPPFLDRLTTWPVWTRAAAAGAASVLVVLAVYHRTLGMPLSSDGRFLTYQNTFMQTAAGLWRVWTADYFAGAITNGVAYLSGYYRPLVNTLFWFEHQMAGTDVWVYHLVNIVLHGINAGLVGWFCYRIARRPAVGILTGVIFALHPVHAFAVSDPAARADLLFPVFYVGALIAFDRTLSESEPRRVALGVAGTTALYLAALASKEMGITLPAVLLALALLHHLRDGVPRGRALRTIPVWGAMGVYLVWRFVVLDLPTPAVGYGATHPPLYLWLAALKAVTIHISRIVLPLGASYPELNPQLVAFVDAPWTDVMTYAAIGVGIGIGALALAWRWNAVLAFWATFFAMSISLLFRIDSIAGTLDHTMVLAQERWIYLPAVAVIAVIAHGIVTLVARYRPPPAALAAVGLLAAGYGAWASAVHAGQHENPFAQLRQMYLWPEERLGAVHRANKLILYAQWVAVPMGDFAEAEARARRAVALAPDSPIPAVALANVLQYSGKWTDVVEDLEPWADPSASQLEAWRETNPRVGDDLNRTNPQVLYHLGRAYTHLGDAERGRQYLCEAARRHVDADAVSAALRESGSGGGTAACGGGIE